MTYAMYMAALILCAFSAGSHAAAVNGTYAWAVRLGDIAPVPVAAWLSGSALVLMGLIREKTSP